VDNILYDVVVGVIILGVVVITFNMSKQSTENMQQSINQSSQIEEQKLEGFAFEDLDNYEIQDKKFMGSEVISFMRYYSNSSVLSEIKVITKYPSTYTTYKTDNLGIKIEEIEEKLKSGMYNEISLYEVKFDFRYDKNLGIVWFE